MATNNSNNPYGFTPPQPGFDPQAFAETLYGKMGAKRTVAPMQPQMPSQAPAQPDLYAQPQRPIKTPFQEQMDRERAARSLREQARATFYQNPANFRYGARQDPNQVAQFDAANQRAIAAERLAADAARARQTVDQGRLVSTDVGAATAESDRMAAIERSKENLRRAAANEQQVRDQQSAEAAKMRGDEEFQRDILRKIQAAAAESAAARARGDMAGAALKEQEISDLRAAANERAQTGPSRVAAAIAANNAAGREAGARADLRESEAASAKFDAELKSQPWYQDAMKNEAVLRVTKLQNEVKNAATQGLMSDLEYQQMQRSVQESIETLKSQVPVSARDVLDRLVPAGVDPSKTMIGVVANNLTGADLSDADRAGAASLLTTLTELKRSTEDMTPQQKSQVRDALIGIVQATGLSNAGFVGSVWETLTNPYDSTTRAFSEADSTYRAQRQSIVDTIMSIISGT